MYLVENDSVISGRVTGREGGMWLSMQDKEMLASQVLVRQKCHLVEPWETVIVPVLALRYLW